MEQLFIVTGTHQELQDILVKEFKLSEDSAKLASMAFVYEQNQRIYDDRVNQETLWYLDSSPETYNASIFETRYTISFTQVGLDIIQSLSSPLILALCGQEEISVVSMIISCVVALIKNCRKIKENECCVYYEALNYVKTHPKQWMKVEDVLPQIQEDSCCIKTKKNWTCEYENDGQCTIDNDIVKNILDSFCDSKIMKKNDRGQYRFSF